MRCFPAERRGFTLIEMLATTALAALLMLAMLSVIAGVGRTDAAMIRHDRRHTWPGALTDTIRRDLAQARTLEVTANGFRIAGACGIDPATLEPSHLPVEVVYSLRTLADRTWLVRTQTQLTGDTTPWTALLAPDVSSVSLLPHRNPLRVEDEAPADKNTVPARLDLTIRSKTAGVPALNETFLLRDAKTP